jgi:hypothetical protein
MRIGYLSEGIISTARGDIINTKNEIASYIATAAQNMGFPEPDTEFSNSTDDNSVVMIELGNTAGIPISQIVMIEVIADDDITIRVPSMLSEVINIHDYYKLKSHEEAILALDQIKSKIKNFSK